jgi:glyoxylase-like metal-dependent hydrolase (beta-lactamase superfamily II)
MPERWTVGHATVTAIVEEQTPGVPAELFFPDASAGAVRDTEWLGEGFAAANGTISFRVQAFLIEQPGHITLVDPCVGNAKERTLPFWNQLNTPWLERLAETGVAPDAIDLVLHTHLHEDHVGWDTHLADGEWKPTFTNARHLYVGDELDYWRSAARPDAATMNMDSIDPIFAAGLADIVTADADLGHGLRLLSTPGHTPGHASVEVTSADERIVITGDLLHHPVQMAQPKWAEIADYDVALARETRHAFLDEHCRLGTRIAGTHFPTAPVGRIEPHNGAWRFAPET